MIYSDGFSYFYEMMFLFILPFSESLKWNKSFFLPFSPGFHQREIKCPSYSTRLSDLHSVEGCHSLEVSFTEIYTFLCSTSLVRFLSMFYLWPILFTLEWKTNSHLVFLIQKKGEKNYRSLQLSSLATLYSLSIYYSSSTGERAEYITEDEKDSGKGGDSSYERGGDARHLA